MKRPVMPNLALNYLCSIILSTSLIVPAYSQESKKKQARPKSTQAESRKKEKPDDPPQWDVNKPPGPTVNQRIDTTEGTWMNLDLSPDGKTIVFDLLGDLYLMPIEGANGADGNFPKKLTTGVSWDMQPRFSPNGKHIVFTSDRTGESGKGGDNIWIVGVDGKTFRQVTDEAYRLVNGAAWSTDGQYIVARKHFSSRRSLGAGEVWMYHVASGSEGSMDGLQLTEKQNLQKDVNEPIFSPDGKYLYYSQDVTSGKNFEYDKDSNKQIYVIKRLELESGESSSYITGPGGSCRPTPSPDGKIIAFVRRVGGKTGLHLFDTASGQVRLIHDELERDMQEAWAIHGVYPSFDWTPDGESIVIWAGGQIRRINVIDGTAHTIPFHVTDMRAITSSVRNPVPVAPDEFDVRMLRWVHTSPTGDRVAYQALGHIYVKTLPDGKPQRLTSHSDHYEFAPSFSRDGKHIVYTTWNDEKLGTVRIASADPDIGENWVVTKEPGHYFEPTFTPDGHTVIYRRGGGGRITSPLWSQEQGLYKVTSRGGESEQITKTGTHPQCGNNSTRLYFTIGDKKDDSDNLQLRSIGLDGKDERTHYTSEWATDYCISADNKWIAFIERFNVYLSPFVATGSAIKVGPSAKGLPVKKVSEDAGEWIHFSGDSRTIHWSLGPDLYSRPLDSVFSFLKADGKEIKNPTRKTPIGFKTNHARPNTKVALVGGRIVTMGPDKIIEDGTIVVEGNRITAVGPRDTVPVPPDAKTVQVKGQTILPGLIDVHAHGAQGSNGIIPQENWVDFARLAFGVTTIHDPSNDTNTIFAASEMTKAGLITAPRTFSTGTILYGASGSYKAEIASLEDAIFHLKRMKAVGAFSVKSYNQPRRDQRQQVIAAARQLEMMVVPEGGSTFMHNMTMIVDGHTGIEHTLPVQSAYDDVMDLWRNTQVGYTPTLSVAYGGISGEQYWYEIEDLWLHPRLQTYIHPGVLMPRARRRNKSPLEDYNHIRVAEIARQVVDDGGLVQAGGHGQLNGICTHWELWSYVQGGMKPMQSLRCGTINGAKYLGLDGEIGSIEVGKLADMIVIEKDHDPTMNIRHSENIEYVVANGRVFHAKTMSEKAGEANKKFFWGKLGGGVSVSLPHAPGCGCQRAGEHRWLHHTEN